MADRIKSYLDEHVPKAVAEGLCRRGVDVITVQELGLQAAEDVKHLERAAGDGRVIITQDADFFACTQQAILTTALSMGISKRPSRICFGPSCCFMMSCLPKTW